MCEYSESIVQNVQPGFISRVITDFVYTINPLPLKDGAARRGEYNVVIHRRRSFQ